MAAYLSTASKSPLNQVRAVIESNSIRAEQQSVDCTLGEPKKYAFPATGGTAGQVTTRGRGLAWKGHIVSALCLPPHDLLVAGST